MTTVDVQISRVGCCLARLEWSAYALHCIFLLFFPVLGYSTIFPGSSPPGSSELLSTRGCLRSLIIWSKTSSNARGPAHNLAGLRAESSSSPRSPFHFTSAFISPCFSLGVSSLPSPEHMVCMTHMECSCNHHSGYRANAKKALYNSTIMLRIFYMKTDQFYHITCLLVGKTQDSTNKMACWRNPMSCLTLVGLRSLCTQHLPSTAPGPNTYMRLARV